MSILFMLWKNQLLALLIFAIVSFTSISCISALIFTISFLLLTLGFFFFLFIVVLCVKLGCLFDASLVSWGRLVLLLTFPLPLLLLNPIGFGLMHFYFHSFLCIVWFIFISFVICWLLRSVLFSLHIFVFLIPLFPPVVDIWSYCIVIRKDVWDDFNFFFIIYQG